MKHGLVFYLFQLLPPLGLIWVVATDQGRFLDLYLGVALMFALYSLVSLFWRLCMRRNDPARMLRPAMVLVVFAGAVAWHRHENADIRAHLLAMAQEMQAACDAARRCVPAPLASAADHPVPQEVVAPGSRVRWKVVCRADDRSFLLELQWDEDWSDTWTGGVATPVAAGTWVDWDRHAEDPRPNCALP